MGTSVNNAEAQYISIKLQAYTDILSILHENSSHLSGLLSRNRVIIDNITLECDNLKERLAAIGGDSSIILYDSGTV